MKKKVLSLLLICATLLAFALSAAACDNTGAATFEDVAALMQSSMESVVSSEKDMSVYDGETKVYGYNKQYRIEDAKLTVVTTESRFNSSFVMEDSTPSYEVVENYDVQKLMQVSLEKQLVKSHKLEKDVLTCVIPSDNVAEVLKTEGLVVSGDATLVCRVKENKISEITCNFRTNSDKSVIITLIYNY